MVIPVHCTFLIHSGKPYNDEHSLMDMKAKMNTILVQIRNIFLNFPETNHLWLKCSISFIPFYTFILTKLFRFR